MWYAEKGFNDAIKEIKLLTSSLSIVLPFEIEELKGLQFLDLSMNNITGSLLERIGNMLMLKSINIEINYVTGTIPTIFGLLKEMESGQHPARMITSICTRKFGTTERTGHCE